MLRKKRDQHTAYELTHCKRALPRAETAARRLGRNDWLLGDGSIADAYLFWLWT